MTNRYRITRLAIICFTILCALAIMIDHDAAPKVNCGNVWDQGRMTYSHQCWIITPQEDDGVSEID